MQVVEMNLQNNEVSAGHQTSTLQRDGSFTQYYLQSGPVFAHKRQSKIKKSSEAWLIQI